MDFLLKSHRIVVEAKITRLGRSNKVLADELTVDAVRYRAHQDCKILICLVYDPQGIIKNPRGFEADITQQSDSRLTVLPLVAP